MLGVDAGIIIKFSTDGSVRGARESEGLVHTNAASTVEAFLRLA